MIRVALAGAGRAATLWGLALAQSARAAKVIAVAAPNAQRSGQLARLLGARRVAPERIGEVGADLVIVAVPPQYQAEVAIAAATGGAAVVIERPMTATLADADRVVALADRGHWIAVAENVLYSPLVGRTLAELARIAEPSYLAVRADLAGAKSALTWLDGATAVALALAARPGIAPVAVDPGTSHGSFLLRYRSGVQTGVTLQAVNGVRCFDLQAASGNGVVRLELLPDPHVERDGADLAWSAPATGSGNPLPELITFGYLAQLQGLIDDLDHARAPALDSRVGRSIVEILYAAAAATSQGVQQPLPYEGDRNQDLAELT